MLASWFVIFSAPILSVLSCSPSSLFFFFSFSLRFCCLLIGFAWHKLRFGRGWRNLFMFVWGNMNCLGNRRFIIRFIRLGYFSKLDFNYTIDYIIG